MGNLSGFQKQALYRAPILAFALAGTILLAILLYDLKNG